MEDFLQVPDYYNMEDTSGKKRVRIRQNIKTANYFSNHSFFYQFGDDFILTKQFEDIIYSLALFQFLALYLFIIQALIKFLLKFPPAAILHQK